MTNTTEPQTQTQPQAIVQSAPVEEHHCRAVTAASVAEKYM